ncbi:MAG TPA: carboxypeptidase regulatory-like domain-containing protein [Thermoanaerobaculia bacterium]|nr:carboxypeptidase regulatory-like domain-containing protein [Thermoanaerobaculia bacterium]
MTLKKFATMLSAAALVLAFGCGGGKEVPDYGDGIDDVIEEAPAGTAAGTAPAAAPAAAVANAATLTGTIRFDGSAPAPQTLQMGADPYCAAHHKGQPAHIESVVVGPGGELANVLVYVKNAPAAPPNTTPALLDQVGCRYVPHVSAVQVNQPVRIRNSDNTLHNVHAMPEINRRFNEGQPVQGMESVKRFDKAEIKPFRIKCDVHGWMESFMAVLPHSWHGVSSAAGAFTIANLPPGSYTLVAWHEKYGAQEQQIDVGPNEQKQVQFTFRG